VVAPHQGWYHIGLVNPPPLARLAFGGDPGRDALVETHHLFLAFASDFE